MSREDNILVVHRSYVRPITPDVSLSPPVLIMEEDNLEIPASITSKRFRTLTLEEMGEMSRKGGVEQKDIPTRRNLLAKLVRELYDLDAIWDDQKAKADRHREKEKEEADRQREEKHRQREEKREEVARNDRIRKEEAELQLERESREADRRTERERALQKPRFKLEAAERMVPQFNEEEVDVFFDAFERVAKELEWPRERWALLVQRALKGKAQHAFAALDTAMDYEALKAAVLAAYGGVPEEYRRKFRSYQRLPGESHLDLCRRQSILLTRWLNSSDINSLEDLKELVLMEQFRNCISRDLSVYLLERETKEVQKAAKLADAWEVIHYGGIGRGAPGEDRDGGSSRLSRQALRPGDRRRYPASCSPDRRQAEGGWRSPSAGNEPGGPRPSSQDVRHDPVCHECHKSGHIRPHCPDLRRRRSPDPKERAQAVYLVRTRTQSPETGLLCQEKDVEKRETLFVTPGSVALTQDSPEVPVQILRDTGASQSILLVGTLDLPPPPPGGRMVDLVGLGGDLGACPVREIYLRSGIVNGPVEVAVLGDTVAPGVAFILGNDLAGEKVRASPKTKRGRRKRKKRKQGQF